jgi:hypothetical protein
MSFHPDALKEALLKQGLNRLKELKLKYQPMEEDEEDKNLFIKFFMSEKTDNMENNMDKNKEFKKYLEETLQNVIDWPTIDKESYWPKRVEIYILEAIIKRFDEIYNTPSEEPTDSLTLLQGVPWEPSDDDKITRQYVEENLGCGNNPWDPRSGDKDNSIPCGFVKIIKEGGEAMKRVNNIELTIMNKSRVKDIIEYLKNIANANRTSVYMKSIDKPTLIFKHNIKEANRFSDYINELKALINDLSKDNKIDKENKNKEKLKELSKKFKSCIPHFYWFTDFMTDSRVASLFNNRINELEKINEELQTLIKEL